MTATLTTTEQIDAKDGGEIRITIEGDQVDISSWYEGANESAITLSIANLEKIFTLIAKHQSATGAFVATNAQAAE